MDAIQLTNVLAEKVLGWKQVDNNRWNEEIKVATKLWHLPPEYFRPDIYQTHAFIVLERIKKLFNAECIIEVKPKIRVTFRDDQYETSSAQNWEQGISNRLVCEAAYFFWKAHK